MPNRCKILNKVSYFYNKYVEVNELCWYRPVNSGALPMTDLKQRPSLPTLINNTEYLQHTKIS